MNLGSTWWRWARVLTIALVVTNCQFDRGSPSVGKNLPEIKYPFQMVLGTGRGTLIDGAFYAEGDTLTVDYIEESRQVTINGLVILDLASHSVSETGKPGPRAKWLGRFHAVNGWLQPVGQNRAALIAASLLRDNEVLDLERPPTWKDGLFFIYFRGEDYGVVAQVQGQPTDGIVHFPVTPWLARKRARIEAGKFAHMLLPLQTNDPGSYLLIKDRGRLAGGSFGPNQISLLEAIAGGTATIDQRQQASQLRLGTDIKTVHWGLGTHRASTETGHKGS